MNQYTKYKPSSIEWIREIPDHWEKIKLKYITFYEKGKNAALYTKEYIGQNFGEFPVYSGQTENEGILGTIDTYDYSLNNALLVTTVGAKVMTLRRISNKFSLSQNCALIIAIDNRCNLNYYYYYLKHQFEYEKGRISLIMQPSLRFEDLDTYFVILPPSEEQTAIADFLDNKTAKIDSLVNKKKKLIELLKEESMAVINQAVTRGIVQNVKLKHSGLDWLGSIPEHWEIKKLKYLAKTIIGITYNPSEVTEEEDGILVLRASNIKNGKISYDDNVFVKKEIPKKYYTQEGDILLCARSGSANLVGKNIYIDSESSGLTFGAFMVIVRSEIGKYLHHIFNSSLFESQRGLFSTSTINQLTSDTLNNLEIIFPDNPEEQNSITDFIETETKRIDEAIIKIEKEIELLNEYRSALISEVVTGKIRVI